VSRGWIIVWLGTLAACGRSPSAPPPPVTNPTPGERITGSERLGWDQRAADAVELSTFRYAIYIDGVRSELANVTCDTSSSNGAYACSARLPTLRPGNHTLELASFIAASGTFESARSAPIQVTVGSTIIAPPDVSPFGDGPLVTTLDRVSLNVERIATGFAQPTDLVFVPDRRVFVAEKSGHIRIIRLKADMIGGAASPNANAAASTVSDAVTLADGAVLALAIDPKFDRNKFVYVLHTTVSAADAATFTITRFREAGDTLADAVVLLDRIPASRDHAAGALRFGPDGKLYAAFDDGGEPARTSDVAAFNGKILRLNAEGTTPDDQAGLSPVFSFPYQSPVGLDWDAAHRLWVADAAEEPTGARITAVGTAGAPRSRGVTVATRPVPRAIWPSSIAFYRGDLLPSFAGNLLVASDLGRVLLRVRFDPHDDARILDSEPLLQDRVGGLRAVTVGPDGAIYFATADSVARLTPTP
jgi:glucose/arabinose dehydrogenase